MPGSLQRIIVTGASGFIGQHFINAAKDQFEIFALARRSQTQIGIDPHPNINWIQVDIADWSTLKSIMSHIKSDGGADYILHLAAYYDFSYKNHPEYTRTNINGTRHMLEQAKWLCVRHFIFASSLTVSKFPADGYNLSENSTTDADFPYAVSKKHGEEMCREYAKWFSVSIVRLAAIFSDWCEYGPLYKFLNIWFSQKWNARFLAGKGKWAVTYLHIQDLNHLFLKIISRTPALSMYNIFIGSPNHTISHGELFNIATRYYFGKSLDPIFIAKIFAYPGIILRNILAKLTGKSPFERLWMLKYVDKKLEVDATRTQRILSWKPSTRYDLKRRLLFLIEKKKSEPSMWMAKNEAVFKKESIRSNLLIYQNLTVIKEKVVSKFIAELLSSRRSKEFCHYQQMDRKNLEWSLDILYQLLTAAVRTGDRLMILNYFQGFVKIRYDEGFTEAEVFNSLLTLYDLVISELQYRSELKNMKDQIYDSVSIPLQLALDEIEIQFEQLRNKKTFITGTFDKEPKIPEKLKDLENFINKINYFY